MEQLDKRKLIGDYVFVSKYAQTKGGKKETWEEAVDRVMQMHKCQLERLGVWDSIDVRKDWELAYDAYRDKLILGAQRALQFGGQTMFKNPAKMYNCTFSYVNRVDFFKELIFLLLSGSGTGISVQRKHTRMLPPILGVDLSRQETFVIPDSIEGWAEGVDKLIKSHYYGGPEIVFDYSQIRKKGAFITGGFRAPGPGPLREALTKIHSILKGIRGRQATPFELHYISCILANAVISGGIRRAAMISQFDADDEEMLKCKTGNWFSEKPELARSNNSAMILPTTPKEVYEKIFDYMKEYGEPGVIFTVSEDIIFNPCCEVSGYPQIETENGVEYGWGACNLVEINGSMIKTEEDFYKACQGAAILGTFQASYTDLHLLTEATRKIFERDALIGVGITGMCESPKILFDERIQREGAQLVRSVNARVAREIGINPAARCTVIKPSGNSSQLLGCTSSGIHPFHFKRFIRNIQAANTEEALGKMMLVNPVMVRPSAYNPQIESVISFPVELPDDIITMEDMGAVNFLELIKLTKKNWIEHGTNLDHPFYLEHPEFKDVRMNVSNTVTVKEDEWEVVKDWVWVNRDYLAGISFIPKGGDLLYPQAPYTSVLDEKELAEKYGPGAILAGGLIVDGLSAFNDDLWLACDVAMGRNIKPLTLTEDDIALFVKNNIRDGQFSVVINGVYVSDINAIISHLKATVEVKRDWVRRFKAFAHKYLDDDLQKTEFCLKHVSLFHRWQKLKHISAVKWDSWTWGNNLIEADSLAAQGCYGGMCSL